MLASTPAIATDEPRFDDFQVREIYKGRTHFPDFKGRDSEFADFRTRISNGLKEGPNFAGHYSIIVVGCGTGCRVVYIADNRTGKVFDFPRGGEDNQMLELKFRVDSRLLIARWASYDKDECLVEFFEWDGSQATVIGKKTLGKKEACWHDARAALLSFLEGLAAFSRGDDTEAIRRFRPLAEQGHAGAQSYLGLMYYSGAGVPQDFDHSVKWSRLGAEQGDRNGQYNLGRLYAVGKGVPKDDVEAAKWWRLAAEQGHTTSQFLLGISYALGKGVPQDYVLAHMWFNLGASASEGKLRDDHVARRDELEGLMTPEQIAEAQRLAREWKPKPAAP
ncbi:MAG: tetratricopeptide repeat protein [Methyloceanibacter sp.]